MHHQVWSRNSTVAGRPPSCRPAVSKITFWHGGCTMLPEATWTPFIVAYSMPHQLRESGRSEARSPLRGHRFAISQNDGMRASGPIERGIVYIPAYSPSPGALTLQLSEAVHRVLSFSDIRQRRSFPFISLRSFLVNCSWLEPFCITISVSIATSHAPYDLARTQPGHYAFFSCFLDVHHRSPRSADQRRNPWKGSHPGPRERGRQLHLCSTLLECPAPPKRGAAGTFT